MPALHHVALRTSDIARLVDFYERWFGLARVRESEHGVWLALDHGVLMIERRGSTEPAVQAASLELLAFEATAEARAACREELVRQGMLEAETAHSVYFRDPDGRRVALSSYPLFTP